MEDILASIRRILSEDEASPTPPPAAGTAATPAAALPAPEDEPLELTEEMLVSIPAPAAVAPPVAPVDEAAPPPPVVALPTAETAARPLAEEDRALLGAAAAAAASASVGTLLRAVAADRSSPVHRGGPSIEDVVREELRPLLKEWLDAHLPPLVERLVRTEIERVVGRGLS
jgi:cell pole-organizing protein PopZ